MSAFRGQHSGFAGADAQVLGVSVDDLETLKKFAQSLTLPFPLLADPDKKAAEAYGVLSAAGHANRVTFVIGKEGKVTKVFEGQDALDPSGALTACGGKAAP